MTHFSLWRLLFTCKGVASAQAPLSVTLFPLRLQEVRQQEKVLQKVFVDTIKLKQQYTRKIQKPSNMIPCGQTQFNLIWTLICQPQIMGSY